MPQNTGQEFMEKTTYPHLESSDQSKGLPQPPLELGYNDSRRIVDLPRPAQIRDHKIDLRAAIENRRSVRRYAAKPLNIEELSFLLWCTQGVKEVIDTYATSRTVPSAGARHAFETYVLANNVAGLQPGLYRFLALSHKLIEIDSDATLADQFTEACLGQTQVKTSAVTFLWLAIPYRMTWRYGERGYRYLHLDAGHVCQNLYLSSEAIGAGVCAIAAFDDAALNTLLGVDGKERFVIYLATVGKQRE